MTKTIKKIKNKEKEKIAQTKNTSQRGITLIALVITIIVMLILVAVTITMAINGGLFENAGRAVGETQNELNKEQQIADGKIQIDGVWYNSIDDYLAGKEMVVLPEGWEETEKPAKWDSDEVIAITDGENIVPLPNGYEIIEGVEGETSVEKGLVIKDGYGNEFVWIPVTEDLSASYSSSSNCSEPKALEDRIYICGNNVGDSQDILNYLYGENYYNYAEDFNYADDYAKMIASVNKYNGFYIGRYETTIDEEGNIGSKYNTEVLTGGSILKEETNPNNSEPYYYRWYGIYNATKNANVEGNGDYVQTSMIWGQQWDVMLKYFDSKSIDYSAFGKSTQGNVVKSGQSTNSSGNKDEIYNIYDLRTNCSDWTADAYRYRLSRY